MPKIFSKAYSYLSNGPTSQPAKIPITVYLPSEEPYTFTHPIASLLSLNALCTAARHQNRDGNFVRGWIVWTPRKAPTKPIQHHFNTFPAFNSAMRPPQRWDGDEAHRSWVTAVHLVLDWGRLGRAPDWRGWDWESCWQEARLWELDERLERCVKNRIEGKNTYAEGAPEVMRARAEVAAEDREKERVKREIEIERKKGNRVSWLSFGKTEGKEPATHPVQSNYEPDHQKVKEKGNGSKDSKTKK